MELGAAEYVVFSRVGDTKKMKKTREKRALKWSCDPGIVHMVPKIKSCYFCTIRVSACKILAGSGGFRDPVKVFTNSCKKCKKQRFCAFFYRFLTKSEWLEEGYAAGGYINQKLALRLGSKKSQKKSPIMILVTWDATIKSTMNPEKFLKK